MEAVIADQRWQEGNLEAQLNRLSPLGEINNGRQRLDELSARAGRGLKGTLKSAYDTCQSLQARLSALNPEAILQRGYAIVSQADGGTIYRVGQTSSGAQLSVRVSDGTFEVIVS
jgi:exodeoxyribonuclease VII large subunit